MVDIIHKLCEALKSPGFPIMLLWALQVSKTADTEDDSVPGDNFPQINL